MHNVVVLPKGWPLLLIAAETTYKGASAYTYPERSWCCSATGRTEVVRHRGVHGETKTGILEVRDLERISRGRRTGRMRVRGRQASRDERAHHDQLSRAATPVADQDLRFGGMSEGSGSGTIAPPTSADPATGVGRADRTGRCCIIRTQLFWCLFKPGGVAACARGRRTSRAFHRWRRWRPSKALKNGVVSFQNDAEFFQNQRSEGGKAEGRQRRQRRDAREARD